MLAPVENGEPAHRASAYYWAPVHEFVSEHPAQILGKLAAADGRGVELEQTRAWEDEIRILAVALKEFAGTIYLEFDVPRLGSRIDAVLISGPAIFPIELGNRAVSPHPNHYRSCARFVLQTLRGGDIPS